MKIYVLLLLVCLCNPLISQTNFDDFDGLYPKGPIPEEFTLSSYSKYQEEIEKNKTREKNEKQDKDFIITSIYEIDRMLANGSVLFNDPVTGYLEKILDSLLVNEVELRNKLRVYTLKSNEANAFSTRQGILFVTTGLISKLNTEAELAFIIAHEISHFTENHVEIGYNQTKDIRKRKGKWKFADKGKRLRKLSNYSQPMEFEADELGFKILASSNYNKIASMQAMGVLLSSHVPESNHVFDPETLNDPALKIPSSYFLDSIPPMVFDEKYDDKKSSHPNIHKRKLKIQELLDNFQGNLNENTDFLNPKEEFLFVKNLCRLESVKLEVEKGFPLNAIYMIPVLKKEFPNCHFLDEYEAKAWYKLVIHSNNESIHLVCRNPKSVEGESLQLHNLIEHIGRHPEMTTTIALKNLYKCYQKQGQNKTAKALWRSALKNTIYNNTLDFDELKTQNYTDAKREHDSLLTIKKDSIKAAGGDVEKETKQVRILSASTHHGNVSYTRGGKKKEKLREFDEDTFYEYGFSDLLKDSAFVQLIRVLKDEIQNDMSIVYELRNRPYHKISEEKTPRKIDLNSEELLVIRPIVDYRDSDDDFDHVSSDLNASGALESIENFGMNNGIKTKLLNQYSNNTTNVEEFIDMNEFRKSFFQLASVGFDPFFIPSNSEKITEIYQRRKIKHLLFPVVTRSKEDGVEFLFLIFDLEKKQMISEFHRRFNYKAPNIEKFVEKQIDMILGKMLE